MYTFLTYLHSLVEVPEADGVDDLQHALVGREGVRLFLEDLVDPGKQGRAKHIVSQSYHTALHGIAPRYRSPWDK